MGGVILPSNAKMRYTGRTFWIGERNSGLKSAVELWTERVSLRSKRGPFQKGNVPNTRSVHSRFNTAYCQVGQQNVDSDLLRTSGACGKLIVYWRTNMVAWKGGPSFARLKQHG